MTDRLSGLTPITGIVAKILEEVLERQKALVALYEGDGEKISIRAKEFFIARLPKEKKRRDRFLDGYLASAKKQVQEAPAEKLGRIQEVILFLEECRKSTDTPK